MLDHAFYVALLILVKDILQEPVSIFLNQDATQRGEQVHSFHGPKLTHGVLNKGSISDAFDLTLYSDENRLSYLTDDVFSII